MPASVSQLVGLWDMSHALQAHSGGADTWNACWLTYSENYGRAWTPGGKPEQPTGAQTLLEICLVNMALEEGVRDN